jgi:hypothetical protein
MGSGLPLMVKGETCDGQGRHHRVQGVQTLGNGGMGSGLPLKLRNGTLAVDDYSMEGYTDIAFIDEHVLNMQIVFTLPWINFSSNSSPWLHMMHMFTIFHAVGVGFA